MSDPFFTLTSTNLYGLSDVGGYASPTFVDIDDDGDLDALIGNQSGSIRFYRNAGTATSPTFAAAGANPFGLSNIGSAASPILVDIDSDGDLDAFVGSGNGNTLFFSNTGTASNPAFAAAATNPFGLSDVGSFANPTFADIDGDGDLDALIGNSDGNTLFFSNTGTASSPVFAAAVTNPFGLRDIGRHASPTLVDIDGDGDLDALIGNKDGNTLFFRNTGTASSPAFAAADTNPFGLSGIGYVANPTFVDIDGDGDLDALIGNKDGNTLFFLNVPGVLITQSDSNTKVNEGSGADTYTVILNSAPTANVTITLDHTNQQVTSDIGNLIFTPANWNVAQTVTVTAVNDTVGEGSHTGVIQHTVSSSDTDYNNHAVNPVIVAITDNDLPAADPVFALISTNPFGLSAVSAATPIFADIDGDGDLDAFVGNWYGDTLFFRNAGTASNPTFAAALTNPFGLSDVGNEASPALVDIDGDGDLDALIGNKDGNTLFFSNTGTASNPAFAAASTNPFGLSDVGYDAKPTFGDIDGDGDLDALVGNLWSGNTLFFRNTGTASSPAFAVPIENPFGLSNGGRGASPTLVDIDGDGDLDAFIGAYYGWTLFYRNMGTASNPAFAAYVDNPFGLSSVDYWASPTFVDINGDGDLDAFVGAKYGNTLYFVNTLNGNQAPTATNLSAAETYTEDIALDLTDIVVSDIDSANITAILTLSDPAAGSLTAATSGAVTSVYNAGTGVWTASGKLADVNALLASVTFTPAVSFNGNFTVSTRISDGVAAEITGSKSFTVIPGVVQITQSGDATAVTEGGAMDTYTVVLGSAPAANVTITLDNTNQQVTSDIGNLTFTPANWNVAQTVTVTAVNDTVGEGSHTGVIQHTVSSPDANYNNLAVNPVIVAITDNDLPAADPAFTLTATNPFGLSSRPFSASPTFVDIDSDGDLDAFIGTQPYWRSNGISNTQFFRNTGTASSPAFAAAVTNPFGLSLAPSIFVDIDGDGDLDAFIHGYYGNTLFFRNTGTASNPAFAAALTNPFGLRYVDSMADIDGDGDLDAFVGNGDGNTLFFENTGTANSPVFTAAATNPFGLSDVGYSASPTFVDMDGDGDLDALIGNSDGNTLFFSNTGTASSPVFAAAVTNPFGLSDAGYFASPTFVDIDGDGDLDAFVGEYYGNTLFFTNNINVNQTPTATNLSSAETYTEDTALNLMDIVVSDDSANITAILTLSDTAAGSLNIATSGAVTSDYNADTGVWTASGALADVNALLAGVTFTPALNFNGNFTVSTRISDGVAAAITGSKSFMGLAVNDAPTLVAPLVDQAIQYDQLGWNYNASASFSDVDSSDSLSYSVSLANGNPLPAWIQIGATTGLMTGTPGFNDRDTYAFNITATDPQGASVSAPLTVAVTGFNAGQLLVSTAGNDVLAGSLSNDTVTYAYATVPVTVSLAITTQQNTIGAGLDTLTHIDNLMGSNYSDSLTGNGQNNVLDGGSGDDKLNGAGGADTMIGGRGNDTFTVNHVGDVAIEYLNKGTDKVSSNVTYTLPANVENLTLTGALAINGTGNDLSNILVGNTGNNLLKGLAGLDKLTGGAGADRFDFDALSDSVVGTNRDVMTDFNHAQGDLIDVSTIDANDSVAGDQAFTFIGNAAFSAAGQLRYNPVNGFIQGNVNNNLTADFEIKLTGAPSVIAADFVL